MTVPTTTPGTLRRIVLLAVLSILAMAIAIADADAAPSSASAASAGDCALKRPIFVETRGRWRCQNLYLVRVTVDGRRQPGESRRGAEINMVKAGEYVTIRCQAYAYDKHTGERLGLYDRLPGGRFIPDKYVRTRWTGRIPGAPVCDL